VNKEEAEPSSFFYCLQKVLADEMSIEKFLTEHQSTFGIRLTDEQMLKLARFHSEIETANEYLHLVAPCSAEEFATRHILESLTMLKHLPHGSRFADIGSGGGLPAIPCLIVREDLSAVLIESKEKKVRFLQTVLAKCEADDRATVIAKQFSETKGPDVSYVTARALDGFVDKLPKLLKWSGDCKLLFFGGGSLGEALTTRGIEFGKELMPLSERRYLFFTP
jgi:16S rRNA (guanine527-N7)-methyltransferase